LTNEICVATTRCNAHHKISPAKPVENNNGVFVVCCLFVCLFCVVSQCENVGFVCVECVRARVWISHLKQHPRHNAVEEVICTLSPLQTATNSFVFVRCVCVWTDTRVCNSRDTDVDRSTLVATVNTAINAQPHSLVSQRKCAKSYLRNQSPSTSLVSAQLWKTGGLTDRRWSRVSCDAERSGCAVVAGVGAATENC
jgi:hypothetical protein